MLCVLFVERKSPHIRLLKSGLIHKIAPNLFYDEFLATKNAFLIGQTPYFIWRKLLLNWITFLLRKLINYTFNWDQFFLTWQGFRGYRIILMKREYQVSCWFFIIRFVCLGNVTVSRIVFIFHLISHYTHLWLIWFCKIKALLLIFWNFCNNYCCYFSSYSLKFLIAVY